MEQLPPGATAIAGSSVPLLSGDGQIETAISLLILALTEAVRFWIRSRGNDK
jgi:hypothetical protein